MELAREQMIEMLMASLAAMNGALLEKDPEAYQRAMDFERNRYNQMSDLQLLNMVFINSV